jgi:hypothetical protein
VDNLGQDLIKMTARNDQDRTAHEFTWSRWIIPIVIAIVTVMGFAFVGLQIKHMEDIIGGIEIRTRQRIETVEERLSRAIQRMETLAQSRRTDTRRRVAPGAKPDSSDTADLKAPSPVHSSTGTEALLSPAPLSSQKIFPK